MRNVQMRSDGRQSQARRPLQQRSQDVPLRRRQPFNPTGSPIVQAGERGKARKSE